MKKDLKILLCFIAATFVLMFVVSLLIPLLAFNDDAYYKNKFKDNKDSFISVAEYLDEIYNEYDTDELNIYVEKQGSEYFFKVSYDEEVEYIEINDEMMENVEKIEDSFGDLSWYKTKISKQKVSFITEGNKYTFVYTFNGEKPDYVNSKVKSLEDGCFMVTPK